MISRLHRPTPNFLDTPAPTDPVEPPATRMTGDMAGRLHRAATKAEHVYPGPVGGCVAAELRDRARFPYLPDQGGRVHQLMVDIERTPLPPIAA